MKPDLSGLIGYWCAAAKVAVGSSHRYKLFPDGAAASPKILILHAIYLKNDFIQDQNTAGFAMDLSYMHIINVLNLLYFIAFHQPHGYPVSKKKISQTLKNLF